MARALEPPRNPFPESVEVGRIALIGSEPQIYFYVGLIAATGCIYMYPLMENQPYAADCERVGFGDITDRGTTHVWGPEASIDTPTSPVWVAVFERRA